MNKVNIVACCMSEMFGHYRIDKYLTNHSFFLNIMTYDINIVNNVDRYIDEQIDNKINRYFGCPPW